MDLTNKIKHAFNQAGTDKSTSHEYETCYAVAFNSFTPSSLLEIGIKRGESLAAWSMLFSKCKITGLDITDKHIKSENILLSNAKIIIGDSTKKDVLTQLDEYDVIIDDGSHYYKDILRTFLTFKDKFKKYYIVEDLMYKQEFVRRFIEKQGFKVTELNSKRKNVPVNKHWLRYNITKGKDIEYIDLKFLIIEKII